MSSGSLPSFKMIYDMQSASFAAIVSQACGFRLAMADSLMNRNDTVIGAYVRASNEQSACCLNSAAFVADLGLGLEELPPTD